MRSPTIAWPLSATPTCKRDDWRARCESDAGTAGFEDIMLVAITGYGREEDRREVRAAGFDHHLIKPIDFELLLGLLGRRQGGATQRPN